MIYSYNKSQRDTLFLNFIWQRTLQVLDRSTVHHQESILLYSQQQIFVILVMLTVC
jgi:hypothetical protein